MKITKEDADGLRTSWEFNVDDVGFWLLWSLFALSFCIHGCR